MLNVLRITNYAIIEQVEVEFSPGLTVLTGETGAGKSIVLGAFRLLLGGRATSDMVRTGAARAGIEGLFSRLSPSVKTWLDDHGFTADDPDDADSLIIRRDILAEGNSRNYINGRSASVSQLRDLGLLLVDMHGQNEHSRLYAPAAQLHLLDSFGAYDKLLSDYHSAHNQWRQARDRHIALSTDQGDAQLRKNFLEFQVQEITQAQLQPGEDLTLDSERKRLANAERLREICFSVRHRLHEAEEGAATLQMGLAARLLQELVALDPSQESLVTEAEAVRFALEDLAEKVRDYQEQVVGDPQRLDDVENRLEVIRTLKRKYGGTLDEVIATAQQLAAELNDIVNHDDALEEAASALSVAEKKLTTIAERLTTARKKAAADFQKQVQAAMHDLELPKAQLKIDLQPTENFTATGIDTCEFLVSLNAGETPRPMRKIASGGEISRIMLAIKSILAKRDQVPTLVFDEIDTGISGEAAARVGERLENLAASHQVMCITHLPQVAARGHLHLMVEKSTHGKRTATAVTPVSGEQRTLALARMLSGATINEESRRFAETLLAGRKG